MSMVDVGRLLKHWRSYPPAHIALAQLERTTAALQGVTLDEPRPSTRKPTFVDPNAIRAGAAMFGVS